MQNRILIISIILLASCTMHTPQQKETFLLPDSFNYSGELPLQPMWWTSFNDPQLNILIAEALSGSFSIRIAKERLVNAELEARQAGSVFVPEINLQGSGSSTKSYSQDGGKANETKNSAINKFSFSLAAAYELDLWGRLRSSRGAARDQFFAKRDDLQTAALSIAAEVAEAWFAYIKNRQQYEIVKAQQQLNLKNAKSIEWQVFTGSTQIADLLQQRQRIEANTASLTKLENVSMVLSNKLYILLGYPPQQKETIFTTVNTLPLLPPLPATGVPSEILQRRPDVHSAWLAFRAADQLMAAAIANRLPKFSFTAELSTSSEHSTDLFNNWFSTVATGIIGPIIDGGNRKYEARKQQSISVQRFYAWKQSILDAAGEVENALAKEKSLVKQLANMKKQESMAVQAVQLATNRYRQGSGGYQKVLLAQISQQNLQQSVVSLQFDLLVNRITLYRALSGGIPLKLLSSSREKMSNNE